MQTEAEPGYDADGDAGLRARSMTLSRVIAGTFSYQGDRQTYDDLQNANLMRVIDRRKGLPVALAISTSTRRAAGAGRSRASTSPAISCCGCITAAGP